MKLIGILIVVREIISLHQKVKKIFLDKPLLRNLWKKLLLERLAILNFLSRVLEYFVAPLSIAHRCKLGLTSCALSIHLWKGEDYFIYRNVRMFRRLIIFILLTSHQLWLMFEYFDAQSHL